MLIRSAGCKIENKRAAFRPTFFQSTVFIVDENAQFAKLLTGVQVINIVCLEDKVRALKKPLSFPLIPEVIRKGNALIAPKAMGPKLFKEDTSEWP